MGAVSASRTGTFRGEAHVDMSARSGTASAPWRA